MATWSLARMRLRVVRMMLIARRGLRLRMASKSALAISSTSTAVTVRTLAARGAFWISAISPT